METKRTTAKLGEILVPLPALRAPASTGLAAEKLPKEHNRSLFIVEIEREDTERERQRDRETQRIGERIIYLFDPYQKNSISGNGEKNPRIRTHQKSS